MASWQERLPTIIIAALVALLAGAAAFVVLDRRDGPEALEITGGEPTTSPGGAIQVYITGAVAQPGVYELTDGARVVDALYQAGGPAADANIEAINLALRLHDEDQVVVPRQGQAPPAVSAGSTSNVAGAAVPVININTASASELDALPGIGEVYSQRIVDSRSWDGPYQTPEDLVARQIIPRATYERISEMISVGP